MGTDEVRILEDEIAERSCMSCGVKQTVNKLGMTAEASKLVQAKCLMCKHSKNAAMIQAVHKQTGVARELEDNWMPME